MIETTIERLHARLALVAPIDGCCIGDEGDPTTWRVDYAVGATSDQITAGNAVLAAFNPTVYSDAELQLLAFQKAADYVSRFFSDNQLMAMEALLFGATQNPKAAAILSWIEDVKTEAKNNYANPNFDQFTPPPYTYLQVMGVA